ncbi:MAG: right-handed parallel beta-helix repeat-containing protein [Treponema sp.]|nr:right-handed parallel beta-helix repeat-containing protein [Treponema sp.]
MKNFFFITVFLLPALLSCKNFVNNEESNLSSPVITEGEESGPFGDEDFISRVNDILQSDSLSSGNSFYISTEGSDSNDGSEAAPFKTFSYAIKQLKAGDILYVKGGTYYQTIDFSSVNGEEDSYITIAADSSNGSGNPAIISGAKLSDEYKILTIKASSYIRISGLNFEDANGEYAAGVLIGDSANHIIIDNSNFENIRVPNPEKKDHVANGILCYGDSSKASINNILIYNNSFADMATGWGECISVVGNCENINIIKNTINKTGNIGIDVGGNYGYCSEPSLDFTRFAYIAQNQVLNCQSAYGDTSYGIYADGGQHIQILENTIDSCSGGIEAGAEEAQKSEDYATYDILIESNKITNSKECALAIGGYAANLGLVKTVKVTQNTFTNNANSDDGVIISLSKCDTVLITKNTFTQSDGQYKGSFVYYSLRKKYSKNVKIENNVFNNVEE